MFAQRKILVVEDNEINRAMLCELLASKYQVLEAENGQRALDILKEHREEICLILLDIVMPVMDGYTFLSIIKQDPAYSSIPVIVTTQNDSEADEVTALSHGATDFVAKPYKPQVILHRVASILRLWETAAIINQFQYDRLTGIYSKEFFYQRAKETLQQYPEKQYDVICSDIENFKLVNDVFGVAAGDQLLCGIADLYRSTVKEPGIYGRLNADQFVCMVQSGHEYTNDLFIKIIEQVNALPNAQNISMKWGIYTIEDRGISVEQMCDRALLAARSIKGQYGKYFAAYDDKLRGKLLREQAIIDSMESALSEGQFLIYFQPKYRIRDDALAGGEALVRWNHPEWGVQSPAEFIPLFEKNGFITKLDQFVWDRTCSFLREWDDKGYPSIPISVNVSRADIYNANIAKILTDTVKKYGLDTSRLHLEITESAYTENPGQIIETVAHLRELGFVIEMDDFGSGYSSLNMLNQMALDVLKLDMKFIQGETAKTMGPGVLHFIMDLARRMHLSVVAEGVETKSQLDRLVEIGCDYVQGYFFARPMPSQEFEKLLREAHLISGQNDAYPRQERSVSERAIRRRRNMLILADDDAQYQRQMGEVLPERFHVVQMAHASSALEYICAHSSEIAAVVISLSLSEFQGLEMLKRIKEEKALWNIPVIVTGPPDEQQEETALELGAADYACKPHTPKSLLKRVLSAVRLASFQERERALQKEAFRDYMTGILNRRGLEAAVEDLEKADAPIAFYLFDLDFLKQINDTYGHAEGDRLIVEFCSLLRMYTRSTDILARYGGDEFVVIMKRMRSETDALSKAQEICQALQKIPFAKGRQVSVSVGIVISDAEQPMSEVLERADMALYQAKANHKGECYLWKEEK